MSLTLYELVTADGAAISPYAWRSRFALAHKGLRFETAGVGFADIGAIGDGGFKTVPVLHHDDRWIGDSWMIADHLDIAVPRAPLFSSPGERAALRFFDRWLVRELLLNMFRVCVLDIHERLDPGSRDYFRASREARLGATLEEAHAAREGPLAELRLRLEPARLALRDAPFLAGEAPGYADYCLAALFIWGGSVATLPLLAANDPLRPWLDRCLALHDGIGHGLALPGLDPA